MTNNNPTSTQVTRRFLPEWLNGFWGGLGILTGVYTLIYLGWINFHWGGEENVTLIGDLFYLPIDLLTVVVIWWVARQQRLDPRLRRAWLILGLGQLSYFIADLNWTYLENVLEVPPFPSSADVFYLAFYPLTLWGLLMLPGASLNRRERWEFLLNLSIVMTTATMFMWYFVIQPTAAANQSDLLTQLVAVGYPIGDLIVLAGIVGMLFRRPDHDTRSALLLFLAGIVFFIGSDLTFGYTSLAGTYITGSWIDSGWNIAHAFFIWAALRQMYVSPYSSTESGWLNFLDQFTKMLPFTALGLGYGLMLYVGLVDFNGTNTLWLFAGVVLLTILMTGGQVMAPSFANLSLRTKLILVFLAVTVLSVGAVAVITNQVVRSQLTQQVGEGLKDTTQTQAKNIDTLLSRQVELLRALALNDILDEGLEIINAAYPTDPAAIKAEIEPLARQWQAAATGDEADPLVAARLNNDLTFELHEFLDTFPENTELFVTDKYGALAAATQRVSAYSVADEAWWRAVYNNGQGGFYVGQPEYNEGVKGFVVSIGIPIYNNSQQLVGVLHSYYRLDGIVDILNQFGSRGGADVLLPGGQILREEGDVVPLDEATLAQLQAHAAEDYAEFFYNDAFSLVSQAPIVSADPEEGQVIDQLGWVLILDEDPTQALASLNTATQTTLLTGLGALLLAAVLAVGVAQPLVAPIIRLTTVAQQIAAGDLSTQAHVEATDEIGTLATAFNNMTAQLRQMLLGLEDRSRALETNSDISRHMTAILDIEKLLQYVVSRIQTEFNFYHTHIYLVEENSGDLVMTEGSGEVGRQLKEKGHRLPVGRGLVGAVATTNQPFLSNNVNEVPHFVRNALLPETNSELAVPLRKGEQVLGVLDIQSEQFNRFTAEDLALMQSIADQIAVALDNARLLQETQQALNQVEHLNRRLTRQAWEEFGQEMTTSGYRFTGGVKAKVSPDSDAWLLPMQQAAAKKQLVAQVVPANGEKARAELAVPLLLRGEVIGVLGVKRDTTLSGVGARGGWAEEEMAAVEAVATQVALALENARLSKEQEKTIVKLKDVDRLKSEFLTSMSHELRTPLNSIIGFADVLLQGIDGDLNDMAMGDIRLIYNSGKHLLALINDILDLAKIEAGKMELVRESLDLKDIVDNVLASSSSLVKDKPVQITVNMPDALPPINADKLRLNQILLNLVSNATKFTHNGTITIRAALSQESGFMRIGVVDTGIGIPPEKLNTIFERFRQADSSTTRKYGGTGLGLAICKQLIEMHGGTIGVKSQDGEGSEFYFTVPLAEASVA